VDKIYVLFNDTIDKGLAVHHEFSRASALFREAASHDSEQDPRLEFGTIVSRNDEYFVCLQPLCDTVRLKENTRFIFAPSAVASQEYPKAAKPGAGDDSKKREKKPPKAFDIVVISPEGENVRLRVSNKASETQTFIFAPDEDKVISARKDGGVWSFSCADGSVFQWIADLRGPFVQRLAQRVANDLSRIGLDEFEWLRQKSDRKA
jgi:hypothetical protein